MPDRPSVALVRCDDYNPAQVEAALRRSLAPLGGMARFVAPGQRVLLKPNLLRAMPPEAGVTTHPAVVAAVARLVQECGATPLIADSPGGPFTAALLRRLYERTGMRQVAEETGALLNYDTAAVRVPSPEGGLLRLVDVSAAVAGADAVINLAKLKTHNLTRLSGAVKNLFGAVPGVAKIGYHAKLPDAHNFARGLVDIARAVRPVLSIIDGIVAMHGNGPSGGDLFPGRALIASADPVAADVVAMALVGWEPLTMPTIKVAVEWGLSGGRLEDIDLYGDPLASLRFAGFCAGSATAVDPGLLPRGLRRRLLPLIAARAVDGSPADYGTTAAEAFDVGTVPPALRSWATRQLVVTPQAGPGCSGCGYCAKHCPVQAIHIAGGRAHMDARRCIRCYCCHELCPQLAVVLRRPWLGRLSGG